jgi:hypothetical protein
VTAACAEWFGPDLSVPPDSAAALRAALRAQLERVRLLRPAHLRAVRAAQRNGIHERHALRESRAGTLSGRLSTMRTRRGLYRRGALYAA